MELFKEPKVPEKNTYSVSVVHLVWLPFGINLFKEFVQSYQLHSSGYNHKLILLFNGVNKEEDLIPYYEWARERNLVYESFQQQKGWDLEMYRWAASQLNSEYVLFLNSYIRFMNDDWLAYFMKAAALPGAGIVGATGTWHSIFSMIHYETKLKWERNKTFKENFRKYKLIVKNFFLYRLWFPPFPNPHIRTSAFLIKRKIFLDLSFGAIKKKYDAYRWESGRNSFTRQIMKRGLKPLITDKNGTIYEMNQWKESHTFWSNDQANLLLTDNQTKKFEKADDQQKKFFTLMAWGHE